MRCRYLLHAHPIFVLRQDFVVFDAIACNATRGAHRRGETAMNVCDIVLNLEAVFVGKQLFGPLATK